MLLRQYLLPAMLRFFTHLAEQIVPTCDQRSDSAGFLILGTAHAIPPVDVQILALECHLLPCYQLVWLELRWVLALWWLLGATPLSGSFSFFR